MDRSRNFTILPHQKSRIQLVPSHDQPPKATAIDFEIARNGGTTVAFEATREAMEAAKKMPTPTLKEAVAIQQWYNSALKAEVDMLLKKLAASDSYFGEVRQLTKAFNQADLNYQRLRTALEVDEAE